MTAQIQRRTSGVKDNFTLTLLIHGTEKHVEGGGRTDGRDLTATRGLYISVNVRPQKKSPVSV